MNRVRCPACGSLRISGDQFCFKCNACGFVHDARPRVLVKPVLDIESNGLVFKPNLGVLVIKKK